MFGFWAAKELQALEANVEPLLEDDQFRKELTMVLLAGLKRLDYPQSFQLLEKESGLQLPEPFRDDFKEFVRQGRFDQALGRGYFQDNHFGISGGERM